VADGRLLDVQMTFPQPPLVSIIIPAFNAELTLRESIESVLASTYANIEVIVVDDGSTDSTGAIADNFEASDARVRVHRQSNGGLSAALNCGFRFARGDYLARLDADDLWHPNKLERQMDLAIRHPELGFIYTFVRYIDHEGRVLRDIAQRFPRHALCRGLYESLVGGGSSALMKRSAVASAGGCDELLKSWEDLLLQLKISLRHPIGFVPEYLIGYRVRPGSLSSDPRNMLCNWRLARQRVKELFPEVPRFVSNWAHGRRCAGFAESFAWQGRFFATAELLLEALWYDPLWTLRFLTYRLTRRLMRRRSPAVESSHSPAFLHCRPDQQIRLDPFDAGLGGSSLRRLEVKRAELLKAAGVTLAQYQGAAAATQHCESICVVGNP
jgi:glycosyltransferase involved in cell wall biosynthesis